MGHVGFSLWILHSTHDPSILSFILTLVFLVNIIFMPLLAPLCDFMSRKKCAFWSDFGGGIVLFCFFLLAFFHIFNLAFVVIFAVLLTICSSLLLAALPGLIPMLVSKENLESAIGINSLIHSFNLVIGVALGGVLVNMITISGVFFVNCLATLIGALCTFVICNKEKTDINASRTVGKKWKEEFIFGLMIIKRLPLELWWNFLSMLINFSYVPFVMVAIPAMVELNFHDSSWYLSILWGSLALGSICASLFTRHVNQVLPKELVTIGGLVFMSFGIMTLALTKNIYFISISTFFSGFGLVMHNVNSLFFRTLATPNSFRSRIMSCSKVFSNLTIPLGFVVMGLVLKHHQLYNYLLWVGFINLLLLPFLYFFPNFLKLMRCSSSEAENFYVKIYPNAWR